jgi:hypothetical protein
VDLFCQSLEAWMDERTKLCKQLEGMLEGCMCSAKWS